MLNCRWTPSPWQELHAPSGELNENTRGDNSGINAPCSGHAKSSDQVITSPIWVSFDLLPLASFIPSSGSFRLSMAIVPPPNFRDDCVASVSLWRFLWVHLKRSTLTSISCLKFLSKVGGFSKSDSWPFTLPPRYPCSTSCLKRSWWVPFLALIIGDHTEITWPSRCHNISSTISCTERLATSLPQVGQWGLPILADSKRR